MGPKHFFQSWKTLELLLVVTAGKPVGSLTVTELVIHVEKSGEPSKKRRKQLTNLRKGFTETMEEKEGPSYEPGAF